MVWTRRPVSVSLTSRLRTSLLILAMGKSKSWRPLVKCRQGIGSISARHDLFHKPVKRRQPTFARFLSDREQLRPARDDAAPHLRKLQPAVTSDGRRR